jgi:hypothetical protein
MQRLDQLAVEILAQRGVGDVERFEVIRTHRERGRIEIERKIAVVAEQDHARGAGPDFDAGAAIAELRAEDARNHDHRRGIGERRADTVEPA